MKPTLCLLACGLLSACASYRGEERLASIEAHQCYFYYRPRHWISHLNSERVNPYVYQKAGYKGKYTQVERQFRRWGYWFVDTILVEEKHLRRFSTPIACEQMDSLSRLRRRDLRAGQFAAKPLTSQRSRPSVHAIHKP